MCTDAAQRELHPPPDGASRGVPGLNSGMICTSLDATKVPVHLLTYAAEMAVISSLPIDDSWMDATHRNGTRDDRWIYAAEKTIKAQKKWLKSAKRNSRNSGSECEFYPSTTTFHTWDPSMFREMVLVWWPCSCSRVHFPVSGLLAGYVGQPRSWPPLKVRETKVGENLAHVWGTKDRATKEHPPILESPTLTSYFTWPTSGVHKTKTKEQPPKMWRVQPPPQKKKHPPCLFRSQSFRPYR